MLQCVHFIAVFHYMNILQFIDSVVGGCWEVWFLTLMNNEASKILGHVFLISLSHLRLDSVPLGTVL